jgi:hypothetical protein
MPQRPMSVSNNARPVVILRLKLPQRHKPNLENLALFGVARHPNSAAGTTLRLRAGYG